MEKSYKLDQQYYKDRKDYYQKDSVLDKAADTYDMFIDYNLC